MITIRQLLEKMEEKLDDHAKNSFIENINGSKRDCIITIQGTGQSYWFDLTK